MDTKEEVEDFEITDYDLQNEFNVDRPRKRMSKAQAIYGEPNSQSFLSHVNTELKSISSYVGHFTRMGHMSVTWHLSLKLITDFISSLNATLRTN